MLYRQKISDFFKNGELFYAIFKSYPSLPKFFEFIALVVSKYDFSTLALKLPSWLLSQSIYNFNKTTSLDQTHLKWSMYTCCRFFYIYQNYGKGFVSVRCSNCHISNVTNIYLSNSSLVHHICVVSVFVMIKIKKTDILVIYTKSFVP